jgi:hypothetical protein
LIRPHLAGGLYSLNEGWNFACRFVLLKRAPQSFANGLPCRHDGRRCADDEEQRHCPQKSRHVRARQSVKEDGKNLPDANRRREAETIPALELFASCR